jgi:hypothetical protein
MNDVLRTVLASLFLAAFVLLWGWVGYTVLTYTPTDEAPIAVIPDPVALLAGLAAGAVSAATATSLGIKIQEGNGLAMAFKKSSWLVWISAIVYAVVGLALLAIWLGRYAVAPELLATFATSVFGWLAGAYAATTAPGPKKS